ncbi:MAG: DJ-1/PfpI family protein [Candidatus Aenigmarchaeota archaeon]|nr:DJ-1/PfpI family protein [Candidatus Aenigmarchaeota archaeon]
MTGKSILMVIAPSGFRDEELLEPKKVFEDLGASVTVASEGVDSAKGMLGVVVSVDEDVKDVDIDDYDALVFPGGSGASVYFHDDEILNLVKEAYEKGKVIGAICIAPSILANAGILEGKHVTSFPSEKDNLEAHGAIYTGADVEQDGKIITCSGPHAATEFGLKIAEVLSHE